MSSPANWPQLVNLQQRCLEARDTAELTFLIANETWHLVHYRQACVFLHDRLGRLRLESVTGLVDTLEDTPFKLWVERLARHLDAHPLPAFTAQDLPQELHEGWAEWWPAHALCLPLATARGQQLGLVLYNRDAPWSEAEISVLGLLHRHFAHGLASLRPQRYSLAERWQLLRQKRKRLLLAGVALLGLALLPVRLSTLAPAEIIALRAETVAAPSEGVVKTFHVQPNQPVQQGQPLFSLDDTTLRNRREIALQAIAVARADALAAGQKAFDDQQSKAELATLQGRVREREAELRYLEESLARLNVNAAHPGVFVLGDLNDWIGKPVVTGERIAQLADPNELGVMVWLPVADAIALEAGAPIRVYLQTSPLSPLDAKLEQTSYQAILSPEGIASYRVRGRLAAGQSSHIGLRGVAKVYGERRPLVYWVLRRPVGALRQWLGL
ncbi:efflux RND transporter periplasmic adaptor subunit [Azotobacter beijerinckii]|uniref:HlyD family secretion protein n=1 Tax=Azotobacter beijerinckii TaxID=170623 RepID=A0A1I4GDK3_9GAMM|nr:HlyD family efflux transporter periplasmic adaptor subunit [Azotobacter beijerinckii]SFA89076.1 HlyD family secretion protein [Azotobacter beijerinckii]SFL27231.1 HlyD family secretion protein [Azotobacter beijerinckii]